VVLLKPLQVVALGGLGEIGKNMMAVRYGEEILVVDAGLAFPEEEMLGIDLVIPDTSYLMDNRHMVKAIVLTHGHEDHVGALPYILRDLNVPIYGTRLTLGMVKRKLAEFGLDTKAKTTEIWPRQVVKIGCFKVEPFRVNHSAGDCVGLGIHTPMGLLVHTGDFKFDQTPVDGEVSDYHKLAEFGDQGVLLLFSDSTNADRPGFTSSERVVGETFDEIFRASKGRILVTSFASNVPRIQQVINSAVAHCRKVAVVGRSMENVVEAALELGYLKDPRGILVPLEEVNGLAPDRSVILTTGSQGEPMSALARIAVGEHKRVEILPGDRVILASTPVPGNEKLVTRTIDNLFRRGAEVIYEHDTRVHVSGHASQEELKLMLNLVRPKFFMPVHGEYRHLVKHTQIAGALGVQRENILLGDNGWLFRLSSNRAQCTGTVSAGKVLVDGLGVGDVGNIVLKDRKTLAQEGILIVGVAMNMKEKAIVAGPDIISRGFVYVRESEELMEEAKTKILAVVSECERNGGLEWNPLKAGIKEALGRFLFEKTGRRPMILPIVMEVKA
jgi:ribonuclease J